MYHAHFGLENGLFDNGIAQDGGVFIGERQQLAIANCKIALTTFDSALVLTGPAGVGKTTLAAAALRDSSTRLALGWLNGAPANASELLELLLAEFGFNVSRTGRVERQQMWRQFLNEASATDSRVFVIAERAEDLAPEILRALESLTTADPNGCRGANIVLLGQAGLHEHLKSPALESLRQRVRLRQRLEPLSADEVRAYLEHHVSRAGGVFAKIFGADAVAALHRYSGGVPRVINNLCETALTLAAALQLPALTAEIVSRVARDMLGLGAEEPAPTANATPSSTASVATAPTATAPPGAGAQLGPAPVAVASVAFTPSLAPVAPAAPAAPAATFAPAAGTIATSSVPVGSEPVAPKPSITPAPPPVRAAAPAPLANRAPAAAPAPLPEIVDDPAEFDGGATDIAHDVLGEHATGDIPDVQMVDFPVLTDAVETPFEPAQRAAAPVRAPVLTPPVAAAPPKPAARAPEPVAAARPVQPAVAPKIVAAKPAPAAVDPAAPAAKPAPAPKPAAQAEDDDVLRQTQTMRALASAKSIDDISNSMAETLFGEADLDMLSAALASAGWSEPEMDAEKIDASLAAAVAESEQAEPDPFDAFDLFGLGPDAPLELIDDSSEPRPGPPRKIASNR